MTSCKKTLDTVVAALNGAAASVTPLGPTHYALAVRNGRLLTVQARVIEDWLSLESFLPPSVQAARTKGGLHACLAEHACWPGGAKYFLDAHGRLGVALDLPLGKRADIAAAVGHACDAFERPYEPPRSAEEPAKPGDDAEAQRRLGKVLHSIARTQGWTYNERASGRPVVSFEARRHYFSAVAQVGPPTRLLVSLCRLPLEDPARRALSASLLSLSGRVRGVRPVVRQQDDVSHAEFEAPLGSSAADEDWERGALALATACHAGGREAAALCDPELAKAYLAFHAAAPTGGTGA